MNKISLQERILGAVWGQFIGDAAAKSIQTSQKQEHTLDAQHSQKNPKVFTAYGDAALALLQSLVHQHGFSVRDFGTHFVETFASPHYPNPINKTTRETIDNYHLALEEGHPDLGYEFQGGADTVDVDNATRLAPLVAMYWDSPNLFPIVDKATRVTQNNELAIAYMRSYARILKRLFQEEKLHKIFYSEAEPTPSDTPIDRHVRSKIRQALDLESETVVTATQTLGIGSQLDECYPAAIHACLKDAAHFKAPILATIEAGGDSPGRAALIGSWLGAHLGNDFIPQEWRNDLSHRTTIESAIDALLAQYAHSHKL